MLGTTLRRAADALALILLVIFSFYLRYVFRYFQSGDFGMYTSVWYAWVQQEGFRSLSGSISNYTPPYMYLLYATSLLFPDVAPVVAVKIPSIVCDVLCASFTYAIVRLKYPNSRAPFLAFALVMLAPTVVANSGLWGQADSIYTSLLLACVYCLMTGRHTAATAVFAAALSFKLQAMFLAPAICALLLHRRASPLLLGIVPVTYAIMMLPAWLAGRPATELARIYLSQANTYHSLSMNAPSLYAWLPDSHYRELVIAGLLVTAAASVFLIRRIVTSRFQLNQNGTLELCMLSLLMTTFLLPKMHDRFFYPADVLSISYGFFFPQRAYIPVFVIFASFFAYQPFLFGRVIIPMSVLALLVLCALLGVAFGAWPLLTKPPEAGAATSGAVGCGD